VENLFFKWIERKTVFTTWLRVRIDGEEGWVGGEGQDLDRLGLPTAG